MKLKYCRTDQILSKVNMKPKYCYYHYTSQTFCNSRPRMIFLVGVVEVRLELNLVVEQVAQNIGEVFHFDPELYQEDKMQGLGSR